MELHEEKWELVSDDGFVYKRLKRQPVDSIITTVSTAPPSDPAAEERNRRERKKIMLLKLKTRYQEEIQNWEFLSNTLKALQDRMQIQPQPTAFPDLPVSVSSSTEHLLDSAYREIVETLLVQVEAQEACINEVSTLCDVAESLCNAEEQQLKQPFVCLPIWESSPRKLITMLCEE
ncbi:hypothetical protein R6Q59_003749 [Mikania micrantha]|uniref:Uncharacterized protein n=1 Tax=Mikania micrantha TaxID=192012 RepID=A0A5N6MLB9_9ASTR|nr:hypothetical protein E3N88_30345 [Mikania micrantha]